MLKKIIYTLLIGMSLHCSALGQSVDDRLKGHAQTVQFIRAESCDGKCAIVVSSTADGDVIIRPGETKYIKLNSSDCTWNCCNNTNHTALQPGIIQVKRDGNNITYSLVPKPTFK
jgi:hypothetical protein